MSEAEVPRRYVAYAVHDHAHPHTVPEATSFEEAALIFAEVWHPATEADGEVSVTVVDCDSGEQHCFTVDIESGDLSPCAV